MVVELSSVRWIFLVTTVYSDSEDCDDLDESSQASRMRQPAPRWTTSDSSARALQRFLMASSKIQRIPSVNVLT